jgi:hypothetical protein
VRAAEQAVQISGKLHVRAMLARRRQIRRRLTIQ